MIKLIVTENLSTEDARHKKLLAEVRALLEDKKLKIEYSVRGKPSITGTAEPKFISVTTCGKYMVAAVSNTAIGIDGEWLGRFGSARAGSGQDESACDESAQERGKVDYTAIAERFFTEEEAEFVRGGDGEHERFIRIWVRKEAFVKFTGKGLVDFPNFSVSDGERFFGKVNGVPIKKLVIPTEDAAEYVFAVAGDYDK